MDWFAVPFFLGGIVFAVSGVYMIRKGVMTNRLANASSSWPTVPGVIVHSSVEVRESTDSEGFTSHQRFANVVFEYFVAGQRYLRSGVRLLDENFAAGSEAQRIVDRYPVGRQVTVYWNPEDPGVALLEPGSDSRATLMMIMGYVFLALMPLFFILPIIVR